MTDPVLRAHVGHLRRLAPVELPPLAGLDAVLVSHGHLDHLDPPSLARLGRRQRIVVPAGAAGPLLRRGFERVEQVGAGDAVRVGTVVVRAVHADHPGRRLGPLSPAAPALGYVVAGSRRVYFAGDTDLFAGMADVSPGLDLALLPIAGWGPRVGPGHLDPRRAAEALRLLRPRVAVPIHWGTLAPVWPGGAGASPGEPVRAFRRHARELAPAVEVRVLARGCSLRL